MFKRVTALVAFLLAALWLPAVQHCEVEALVAIEAADAEGCCAPADGCHFDGCELVEGLGYQSVGLLKVDPPALWAWAEAADEERLPVPEPQPGLAFESVGAGALDWVPCWHFTRRMALAPRAPSFGAA